MERRSGARRARAALLLLVAATAGACAGDAADDGAVRAVFVDASNGGGPDARAARGATLAAEEAARAGELVGRRFALEHVRAASAAEAVREAGRLLDDGAVAVIGGFEPAACRALDSLAAAAGALYVNVGCADGVARDPERHPRAFHVAATEAMLRGAGTAEGAAPATLWHAGLTRYGAAQLNERFTRRFDAPMEGPEWAGWMAVKVVAEAALRASGGDTARVVSADSIAAYLVRTDVAFDGHKGEPLRFGADDHQLRQPVYVADAGGAPAAEDDEPTVHAMGLPRVADRSVPLLVVSNEGSASVTVLDARADTVVGVVPLGHRPRGIHAAPDGSRVYVATSDPSPNAQGDGDAIIALDPRTGAVLDRIRAGSDPEQFALSPDGSRLYAANEDAGLATVTDLRAGEERASLAVGIEPEGVAVSPDGRWAYVAAETSNTVSVIDARTNRVVASFLVDVRPRDVAFAPDGRRAYVTNEIAATVSVVDVARHAVVATIPLARASKPVGVVVSPDSRRVFVALGGAHGVAVIDAATGAVTTTVPVGRRPWGVALSPDGRRLYTANGVSGDVSVVDTGTLRVVATVPVGERPWGVAWVPGAGR